MKTFEMKTAIHFGDNALNVLRAFHTREFLSLQTRL